MESLAVKSLHFRRTARAVAGFAIALLVAIQIVPYGHATNVPDPDREIAWNSPRTAELARRACYDCHSNETDRPWFTRIAPVSWRVQSTIEEARTHLNFSEWDRVQPDVFHAANAVIEGTMPPTAYRIMHPEARLTPEEEEELIDGIYATLGIRRVVHYEDLLGKR